MSKILIVDDYQEIRDLYFDFLTKKGHKVVSVETGEQAVPKILEGGYDLILLDLLMPKRDGVWVLEQVQKGIPKKPNGKILVMGFEDKSENNRELIEKALKTGASGFINKRVTSEEDSVRRIEGFLEKG